MQQRLLILALYGGGSKEMYALDGAFKMLKQHTFLCILIVLHATKESAVKEMLIIHNVLIPL